MIADAMIVDVENMVSAFGTGIGILILDDLAVDTVEKAGKIAHDTAYQQVFEPFNKPFPEKIQMDIPPSSDTSRVVREVLVRLGVQSAARIEAAGSSESSVFRAWHR